MPGFGPVRGNVSYPKRCKYCSSTMTGTVIPRTPEFRKTGVVYICPRCDAPSPPLERGVGPGGDDD